MGVPGPSAIHVLVPTVSLSRPCISPRPSGAAGGPDPRSCGLCFAGSVPGSPCAPSASGVPGPPSPVDSCTQAPLAFKARCSVGSSSQHGPGMGCGRGTQDSDCCERICDRPPASGSLPLPQQAWDSTALRKCRSAWKRSVSVGAVLQPMLARS